MDNKDRAINLGLKINSLKKNFSVASSVIIELENEIKKANIENSDREQLLKLYSSVTKELKGRISPEDKERNRILQLIEDGHKLITQAKDFKEADKIDGYITSIEEQMTGKSILEKEHKFIIKNKILKLRELHKIRVGQFLKRNYENLRRNIVDECDNDNPFHVSVLVKKYNEIVKTTAMFNDDRTDIQALLDTHWQQSSRDIKEVKLLEKGRDDKYNKEDF
ncbi:MAG: hypothetical protein OCD02_20035 [Spirochaetaceae bacterium]